MNLRTVASPAWQVATLVLAANSIACDPPRANSRDDGSIYASQLAGAPRIEVDSAPIVRVGGLRANPDLELNARNGLLTAVMTREGGVAVADGARLFVFASDGSLLTVTGQAGSGPNESRLLGALCRTRGDSLVAYDVALRRVNVYTPGGALARQFTPTSRGIMPAGGCFSDGSIGLVAIGAADHGPALGWLIRISPDGDSLRQLGPFRLQSAVAQTSVAISSQFVWIADPQTDTVVRYRDSGHVDARLRFADPARELGPSEVEASRLITPAAGNRREIGVPRAAMEVAPRYERALADGAGRLWLLLGRSSRGAERWVALDSSGHALGQLHLAESDGIGPRQLLAVQEDLLLVLHRDADGVAWVEALRRRQGVGRR